MPLVDRISQGIASAKSYLSGARGSEKSDAGEAISAQRVNGMPAGWNGAPRGEILLVASFPFPCFGQACAAAKHKPFPARAYCSEALTRSRSNSVA